MLLSVFHGFSVKMFHKLSSWLILSSVVSDILLNSSTDILTSFIIYFRTKISILFFFL